MTEPGWKSWQAFIEAELKAERDRRTTLDSRATATITTSGALLSLLTAAAAVGTREASTIQVSTLALWLAAVALAVFVASGLVAVAAGRSVPYRVADELALASMSTTNWYMSAEDATQVVMYYNSETLQTLRKGNNGKARLLILAAVLQVLAVASLSAALGVHIIKALAL